MSKFRLLAVEDSENELVSYKDTIDTYQHQNNLSIELVVGKNVSEALCKLDNSLDGAIIDLNLGNDEQDGKQIIAKISDSRYRIPIAILTGTPDAVESEYPYIRVFTKGEPGSGYKDVLDHLVKIHNTGLTQIMGGRGAIEKHLELVFRKNLLPHIGQWIKYGGDNSEKTQKALLRYTLGHLQQLLDDDEDPCFPEEVYLHPPLTKANRTGSIVKRKGACDSWYVVLNPACDLVIRQGKAPKTNRILLAEIEKEQTVLNNLLKGVKKTASKKSMVKAIFGNSHFPYSHWLPPTTFFDGGFLSFRKLSTWPGDEFDSDFEKPYIQIAPPFCKRHHSPIFLLLCQARPTRH